MDFLPVATSIFTLFILIGIGFIAFRLGYISRSGASGLSSLLVNVSIPCLIVESMQVPLTSDLMQSMKLLVLIEIVVYAVSFAMAVVIPLFLYGSQFETGVLRFMLIFSNLGFMGYPVAYAMFGTESVFYVTLINLPFGFMVFTIGVFLLRPDLARNPDLKRIITPGLIASCIGLVLLGTGLTIPSPVNESISLLGSITTPLAMIVIGTFLAPLPFFSMISDFRVWVISVVRLLVIPFLVLFIIRSFTSDPLLLGIPVLLAAMPVAANTVLLSEEYGVNAELASKGVFISTLLSLGTIPVIGTFLLL
ncbi:MAG: AEC family transporter [Methanomicrobiales archaeon]|nr:AEC family transporter [Methanomicrobiales archaeon]